MKSFWRDETGMETVEWAVVAALVILGVAAAFRLLGDTVETQIRTLNNEINS
jgi:Flp pilus assembly pilin Flp